MDINELKRRNKAAQAELQKDMADRRQRRLNGEFDHENDPPPPRQVLNDGERQVRRSQPVDADAAMNRWFSDSYANHSQALRAEVADGVASHNQLIADLEAECDAIRRDNKQWAKEWAARMDRKFCAEVDIMRDAMLRQNSENLTEMKRDLLKLAKKDIVAEVLKVTKAMGVKNAANVTDIGSKRKI